MIYNDKSNNLIKLQGDTAMAETKLQSLLEEDREMIMGNLSKDRSPEASQNVLEKALDRLLYRFLEKENDEAVTGAARTALLGIKYSLPFLCSASEIREWKLSASDEKKKKKLRPIGLILLIIGLVLVLIFEALLLGSGEETDTLYYVLPAAGALFLLGAGLLLMKPAVAEDAKKKLEILTDPQSIWHTLTGAVLIADNQIKEASEFSAKASGKQKIDFSLTKDETELFSSLLEAAYARRNTADGSDSEELISDINYYLHTRGVETEDCSKENEKRFELLPARRSGTIRPALVSNGKLLKKGLASVSEG